MGTKKITIGINTIFINGDDLKLVEQYSTNNFTIVKGTASGTKYATIKKMVNKKIITAMVSRIILGITNSKSKCVMYKDGNPLNLLRSNLVVTTKGNAVRGKSKSFAAYRTSIYVGVSFAKHANKWKAQIKPSKNKSNKHIGYFTTELEAAEAYNDAAKKFHGEFATINKI